MSSLAKFSPGPFSRALLVGLLVFGAVVGLGYSHFGQTLENLALDIGYTLRPASPPPPELLIVGIDEASFQELKRPWPWSRKLHAQLVQNLVKAGARLIIFDVLFADPTTPEADLAFAEAIQRAGNVILACTIEKFESPSIYRQTLVEPLKMFSEAASGVALFVVTPDSDGVVRRFHLRLGGLDTMPALVAKLWRPQHELPADLSGLINFVGPMGSIETISYYQVLNPELMPKTAKIKDRIVLIGRIMQSSIDPLAHADNFYTPFVVGSRQAMSGVEMQGHIISTVLRKAWGEELQWLPRLILSLLLVLGFSILAARLSPLPGLVALLVFLVILGFVSLSLFILKNFWMPPVLAMVGLIAVYATHSLKYLAAEIQEKRWLRQAFSRYVSPSVVEIIAADPQKLELGGEEVDATILFADLTDFTALSERLPPKEIITLLDEYFTAMTSIILAHKGTVDKYIGDGIMCFWGAPLPQRDHAILACSAALDMQEAMRTLNKNWVAMGHPDQTLRIGLHSGRVVAGNVGSRDRFNYTVMGDPVNLTFRLEKVNKFYGSKILLSEATYQLVKRDFMMRELDRIMVKGRTQSVTLYELLGPLPQGEFPAALKLFADAIAAYRRKDWHRATEKFQEVLRLNPDDTTSQLYYERAAHFLSDSVSLMPNIHKFEKQD
ncbi:MAG: CHASE2 domain-containing protein [Deltaproteobacteria bacterium]|nr:CHASE2 domain-containing protein [Deltaproteobacteria bacterium]